jgi:hypothetical protein
MDEDDKSTSVAIAESYIKNQMHMYEDLPPNRSFMKVLGANHLAFSTIGRLISDVSTDVIKTIQEVVSAFLEEYLKGEQGTYSERIFDKNRPLNLVEIDGSGITINNKTLI